MSLTKAFITNYTLNNAFVELKMNKNRLIVSALQETIILIIDYILVIYLSLKFSNSPCFVQSRQNPTQCTR